MSYDGLYYDQLPEEVKEHLSATAGAEDEGREMDKRYKSLMDMMEVVDKRNHAIIAGNMEAYEEYTKLLEGDINMGDC